VALQQASLLEPRFGGAFLVGTQVWPLGFVSTRVDGVFKKCTMIPSLAAGSAETRSMPIRPHLDGHKFDPETIRVMGLAFEMALAALRLINRGDPANEVIAQKIITLAKAGERDPERLCEGVLKDFRKPPPVG
jgi:hypothetical protein